MNVVIYILAFIGAITILCAILLTIGEFISDWGMKEALAEMKARIEAEERAHCDEAHKKWLEWKAGEK